MATATLHAHPEQAHPLHRLPFVNRVPGKAELSFWAVPKTGGYHGGTQTGEALARLYLKHLKAHGGASGEALQMIALAMFGFESDHSPEQDSLHGQAVGFFWEMDRWLADAVQQAGGGLDRFDDADLLRAANAGLIFDERAYLAACEAEYRASLDGEDEG